MERRLSATSRRSAPSAIQRLSHLAQRVGAVNLAEGFPDFPAPPHVKAAAVAAIAADLNQYRFPSPRDVFLPAQSRGFVGAMLCLGELFPLHFHFTATDCS
jgi:hypothetical protein